MKKRHAPPAAEAAPPADEKGAPDVYVAGRGYNEQGNPAATLWKNGEAQHLGDGAGHCYALPNAASVFVSDGDVYVAGYEERTMGSGLYAATLWKNGEARRLGGAVSDAIDFSKANSVFVSDGDVYVAGGSYNAQGAFVATLWKNGEAQALCGGESEALSVFVSGGDVYVAGHAADAAGCQWATLWKNGQAQTLDNGGEGYSEARSVFVSGEDVYVAGYDLATGVHAAMLRKNGAAQRLGYKNRRAGADSVFVSGGDVYVAGSVQGPKRCGAVLWKNGEAQLLGDAGGHASQFGMGVFVSGQDVYVVIDSRETDGSRVLVCKNGSVQALTDGKGLAGVSSVFVK